MSIKNGVLLRQKKKKSNNTTNKQNVTRCPSEWKTQGNVLWRLPEKVDSSGRLLPLQRKEPAVVNVTTDVY